MKNSTIIIIVSLFVTMASHSLLGQKHIQVFPDDTLKISIDQSRGLLQWEISYDSINWSPIVGQQAAMLETVADSLPAWFRLEIIEGECLPWYSEVLTVTEAEPFICGNNISHGYVSGVTPDNTAQFASRSYSTVQGTWPGQGGDKCWLKMNLGATKEASNATDTDLDAAGWFFQFNRKQAFVNDGVNRIPNTPWINPINENFDWVSANDPCTQLLGGDWRLPTQVEWNAFLTASTAQGGVGSGYLSDAYASTLKIHAGGNLSGGDGSLQNVGNYGYFWSAIQNSNNTAGSFRFSSSGSFPVNATKNFGFAVRCIND